jgi:hypothetical protein
MGQRHANEREGMGTPVEEMKGRGRDASEEGREKGL